MDIAFMDDPCATLDLPRSSRETPKLIVYDLDDTIWFPELYMIAGAPFVKDPATKKTTDASGVEVRVYPAARASISLVDTHEAFSGTKIAVASRTHRGQWARTLMSMFDIADDGGARSLAQCVSFVDVASGTKKAHFARLREASGVEYEDMLFFDNEGENCVDVAQLGVICVHCPGGMTADAWNRGLALFADTRG
jgi:magnesium-dependent phosphatase 1